MICKDCYHYDVCHLRIALCMDFDKVRNQPITNAEKCEYFKDKSLIVELPCKVLDNFFIIAQMVERGKYTEYFVDERQVSCFEYDGKNLTVCDFDGINFDIDDVHLDRSKAEAKLKELNNETS